MKKISSLLVILPIISLLGFSATCQILEQHKGGSGNIITVDNEPGDADYTSIKEALNHSSPGDTIEVYSGTYKEHGLTIADEGISLRGIPYELGNGSDTGKPYINGQGLSNVIDVRAQNATITGFRMQNQGLGFWSIIIVHGPAYGCVISNNTLCYAQDSIIGCYSNYSKVVNNTIKYAYAYYGIWLSPYFHNLVSDNIIDHCPTGIYIFNGAYNDILRNRISNCSSCGIDIVGSGYNTCQYNSIENNAYGVHLYEDGFNHIKQNNFINNTVQAGFFHSLQLTHGDRWNQNYWNKPYRLPYPIFGRVFLIVPWVQFDWRPAQEPYDIS